MQYVGVDIIEITRVEKAIALWGNRFLQRVYTEAELEQCHQRPSSLAVGFAGKEAVMKLLGTGKKDISWRDIETLSEPGGKPLVHLYGKAKIKASSLGVDEIAISLSHSKEYAIACAVA
jgi:holo-[acyl-carrier protein] synthase